MNRNKITLSNKYLNIVFQGTVNLLTSKPEDKIKSAIPIGKTKKNA